ncbi:MAG: DUF1801 domain-containing protein [Saprospiraceae bacterium]|nr:DUF1801 domain-containing protein [Saprospiraceae bacterium]
MNPCLDYIYELEGDQQQVMLRLHELITSYPEVTGKIRYKIPFYYRKSWICYLNPTKDGRVELAFTRANELSNEQGVLDFKNRKQVASITYTKSIDIQDDVLHEILQEALLLDEEVKYASKRKHT